MVLRSRQWRKVLWTFATALPLLAAAFGVLVPRQAVAVQSVPYLVNFQGRLTDNSGNALADGSYNIKFRLWTASTSGTNLWEGDRVMGVSDHRITVTNGLFNIQLGDTTQGDPALSPSIFNTQTNATVYLEVELPTPATATCATNGCASFTEGAMTPRQLLASATYAFNSDTLDGLDSSAFGQLAATNTWTAANLFAPGASAVVGLTVKASTGGTTNSLEVFDSGGTRQAYFNPSGQFNVAQTIQPTANNTVDVGASTLAFKNVYTGNVDTGTASTALTVGTVQASSIGIGRPAASLTIDGSVIQIGATGNNHTFAIGNGISGVQGITIGSAITTSTTIIEGGATAATAIAIGNGNTDHVIKLGTGTGVENVSLGSANGASTTTINGGTGNINLITSNAAAGVIVGPTVNSTTAFQVQNAVDQPIFLVDTATSQSGNFVTYGGFEQGTTTPTGWAAIGAPTTFARNTTAPNHYGGLASLQLVTTATAANQGATTTNFNSAPSAGTYTLSFYALQTSGTALASNTLQSVINGTATACTAGVTLSASGFQRIICPVTAGATITSLGIQVPSGSAGVRTFYLDGVQLVSGSSATPASATGAIQLRGAVDAPVVFQSLSNSTTAFQIQNAAGTSNLFVADTLNGAINVGGALNANQTAGVVSNFTSTGVMTADQIDQTNVSSANAPTVDGINLLQQTFFGKPATGNQQSSTRINVTNSNTAAGGQVQGLRVVATGAGGAVASDTDGILIDPLTNASTGTANENALEIGTGWDAGIFIQSGGNVIKPTTDTQYAFDVQNSTGSRIFTVDTESTTDPLEVQVGMSSTIDAIQVNLGLDSSNVFAETQTCATTTNQGAMYYNTATNAIRSCVNGTWEDVVTTAGLGILAYGVVADTGTIPGNIAGKQSTTAASGPCKVGWASATSVAYTACSAYSGGRKVVVTAGTITGVSDTNNQWTHICLSTTTGQPAKSTAGTETANLPTFSASSPVVCLADIKGTGTNIQIYDTRVFTNSVKNWAFASAAMALGTIGKASTDTIALPGTGTNNTLLKGVVVASSGAAWAAGNGPNAILVVGGPAFAKATAGTAGVNIEASTGTSGYVFTNATASTGIYGNLGVAETAFVSTCTNGANCNLSILFTMNIR